MNFPVELFGPGLLVLALVVGCRESPTAQPTSPFEIDGIIDESTFLAYSNYRRTNLARPVRILVRSPGGDSRFAIKLGDAMLEDGAQLSVHGICHSACIQYLVPSAASVVVAPGTSIGFHSSPADLQPPAEAPAIVHRQVAIFSDQENGFYRRRGVDPDLIAAVRRAIEPICGVAAPGPLRPDVSGYGLVSRFTVVIPDRSLLRRLGYHRLTGYWPTSGEVAMADAARAGFSPRLTVRFVQTSDLRSTASTLSSCPSH